MKTKMQSSYSLPTLLRESLPEVKTYISGDTIFRAGDTAQQVYWLRHGIVKLSHLTESGDIRPVALLRESSLFGILPLLTRNRDERRYFATALTEVVVQPIPIAEIERMLATDATASMQLFAMLSIRLLEVERLLEVLVHHNAEERLIRLLVLLCQEFGRLTENGTQIDLSLTHQDFAEFIGTTRVTVTRLMGQLRKKGVISTDGGATVVHGMEQLRERLA
jgi:CRP-like cAMP-binding protein